MLVLNSVIWVPMVCLRMVKVSVASVPLPLAPICGLVSEVHAGLIVPLAIVLCDMGVQNVLPMDVRNGPWLHAVRFRMLGFHEIPTHHSQRFMTFAIVRFILKLSPTLCAA